MRLDNSLFRVTPKTFKPIDINLASAELFPMVDSEMTITTEHQSIITSKFIGIDNRAPSDGFDGEIENRLATHIFKNLNPHPSLSLQNAEKRHFVSETSTLFSFTPSPKIGFIRFNLILEEKIPISRISSESLSKDVKSLKDRRIRQAHLLGGVSSRDLQFKELNQPKPVFGRDVNLLDPSSGKVRKLITTLAITVTGPSNSLEFSSLATGTEMEVVFLILFLGNFLAFHSCFTKNSKDLIFIATIVTHKIWW